MRTTESQWEGLNKKEKQKKTSKLSSDPCIRARIFEPTQHNQAAKPSITGDTSLPERAEDEQDSFK